MDRRGPLLLLVLALFLAPIVASAIVPDPTWIAGVYDDSDCDAVAILVWERTSAVAPSVPILLTPVGHLLLGAAPARPLVSRPLPHLASRAPPQA